MRHFNSEIYSPSLSFIKTSTVDKKNSTIPETLEVQRNKFSHSDWEYGVRQ
jgi:hypothetical protein